MNYNHAVTSIKYENIYLYKQRYRVDKHIYILNMHTINISIKPTTLLVAWTYEYSYHPRSQKKKYSGNQCYSQSLKINLILGIQSFIV